MRFRVELLDIAIWKRGWWVALLGVQTWEWEGYLFFVDDSGYVDAFWLRKVIDWARGDKAT